MKKIVKLITTVGAAAIMLLTSTPMTSMAYYTPEYHSWDYWRIGTASDYYHGYYIDVGDANEDGDITFADYITIVNTAENGFHPSYGTNKKGFWLFDMIWGEPAPSFPDHMDINHDGKITHQDADILYSFLLSRGY